MQGDGQISLNDDNPSTVTPGVKNIQNCTLPRVLKKTTDYFPLRVWNACNGSSLVLITEIL